MIISNLFRTETQNDREHRIIAKKDLAPETILCRFWGPLLKHDDTKALRKESYALQVGADAYRLLDPPYRYFNHSCEPNCGLNPALDLVVIKPVKEGEELCWDYSTSMLERDWKMTCHCGKAQCRKVIGDFDRLPLPLQEFYINLNIVQAYILQVVTHKVRKAS